MVVLAVFVALVFVGQIINISISAMVEQFSHTISLFVFLGLFALVFAVAWVCAVYITERFLTGSPASSETPR